MHLLMPLNAHPTDGCLLGPGVQGGTWFSKGYKEEKLEGRKSGNRDLAQERKKGTSFFLKVLWCEGENA